MSDIIRPIEPFEITQGFGQNPQWYKKFGIKAHNGWDIKTKIDDTPNGKRNILASWHTQLYRIGFDPGGYGNFYEGVVKLYSTWKLTKAHCSTIHKWETREEGEIEAISGSTGNSTGDHVHLTVKRISIVDGKHVVLEYNNGYKGAVNPQEFFDELRAWKKEHGNKKVEVKINKDIMKNITVDIETWEKVRNNSESYDSVTDSFGLPRNANSEEALRAIETIRKNSGDREQIEKTIRKQIDYEFANKIKEIRDEERNNNYLEIVNALNWNPEGNFEGLIGSLKTLNQRALLLEQQNSDLNKRLLASNSEKNWWESKTVWFNIVMTVINGAGFVISMAGQLPEQLIVYALMVQGFGNIVLRTWFTDTRIKG